MPRCRGTVLAATALAALALLGSGCTSRTAGKASFGATGLATEPLPKIAAAVESFVHDQKSVHIKVTVDGDFLSDADISEDAAEGTTVVNDEKVDFRTVDGTTYVQQKGEWSKASSGVSESIQSRTRFSDVQTEFSGLDKSAKKAVAQIEDGRDVIVLSDSSGTELSVLNDPDNAAPQHFHLVTGSETGELELSGWSGKGLDVKAPDVS
jgi:hypothetical protein